MKVAMIKGPFLNAWEVQNYEPLLKNLDIIAYYSNANIFDVSKMTFPKKQFKSIESVSSSVGISFYHHMIGLEKQLKIMDIAHTTETYNGFSYQAIRAKKKYGTKVVVTQWENIPHLGESKQIIRKIKESVRSNADLFIAITERAKQALLYEGVPEEKITLSPMGIDIDAFKPNIKNEAYLTQLGLKNNDFVILFIGRLVWEKGIFDLLYSFKRLLCDSELDVNNLHMVLVGGGDIAKIISLINLLGISKNTHLLNNISYEQIPLVHNLADVFVLPSIPTPEWQEQLGMVLIESMSCGKPVISTYSGSIPEVIGNAGILVQPNDPLSLYCNLKEIIMNEKLRSKLSKDARHRVEMNFNCIKIAQLLEKKYCNILGEDRF